PDLPPPYEPHDPNGGKALQPGTERVSSPRDLQKNLESAIQSSRPYNSSSVFTRPQTTTINEDQPRSYCDSKPGHDLTYLHDLLPTNTSGGSGGGGGGGIKLFLSQTSHYHSHPQDFLTQHSTALTHFANLLTSLSTSIFSPHLSPQTLNIFYDDSGSSIAFNTNGSLFCNLRFYLQLHHLTTSTPSPEARVEAGAYWWITLCHELAHNLVGEHSAQHSYYTESFVAHYFRRMVWWAGREMVADSRGIGGE
ncbi:hypothetical protein KC331_g22121, partial [Hortaea werneckii]